VFKRACHGDEEFKGAACKTRSIMVRQPRIIMWLFIEGKMLKRDKWQKSSEG